MQSSSSGHQMQHNKNALIRRPSKKSTGTNNVEALASVTEGEKRDSETIYSIQLVTDDKDPDSAVVSLEAVADVIIEGVIVFDFGKIVVYFNPWTDFLNDIENTAHDAQKDISLLPDVYSSYKTFLLYRDKNEKVLILPRNQNFHTIFKRLKHGLQEKEKQSQKTATVLLKDIINTKHSREQFKEFEHMNPDQQYYQVNYVFASKTETRFNERESDENTRKEANLKEPGCSDNTKKVAQTDLHYEKTVSLKLSKKKANFGLLKANTTHLPSVHLLPWLPPSLPRERIFIQFPFEGRFHLPVQESDEQRDDNRAHSDQVVSHYHSTIHRDDISYGLSQHSVGNNTVSSHVTSNTQSAVQHRPRVQPRHPNYSDYSDRLMSYTNWPHRIPNPPRLSQSGFFFTDQGDLVRCFQCGIGLKDFSDDDDPLLEHVRHSRRCQFLPEVLGEDGLVMYQNRLQAVDPEFNRQQQWAERQNGSFTRSSFRHPEYQTVEARLSSFSMWPRHMTQTPQQLADAGLYYTGFEDQVRCFACDGGLRRWDPEDDPWTEHCRWFPACPYALEQKGEQYIALVQASVENEGYGASGGGVQDVTSAMEQLNLRESVIEAIMAQQRAVYLDMGYKEDDVKEAVQELLERGNERPSLEDIIVLIDVIRERKQINGRSKAIESPLEENQRLKRIVFCMSCNKNNVNALFLPCTHHELCMSCADPLSECPVCHRAIREKIRTYMA